MDVINPISDDSDFIAHAITVLSVTGLPLKIFPIPGIDVFTLRLGNIGMYHATTKATSAMVAALRAKGYTGRLHLGTDVSYDPAFVSLWHPSHAPYTGQV